MQIYFLIQQKHEYVLNIQLKLQLYFHPQL